MIRCALLLLGIAGFGRMAARGADPAPEEADAHAAEMAVLTVEKTGGFTPEATKRLDEAFAKLEAKYPRSSVALDAHGCYLEEAGRMKEARAKWEEGEKLNGNDADICCQLGYYWLGEGDAARATGYLERAVALAPDDAALHHALGTELYLFRHQVTTAQTPETAVVDHALAELRKAAELEPLDVEYARGYAETFYGIPVAKWPEALKAWQHFYEIARDKDLGAINLARVRLKMNDGAGAREYLGKVTGSAYQGLKRKMLAQAGGD